MELIRKIKMAKLFFIFATHLSIFIHSTSCSYMGTEKSLRQNIVDAYQGKLKFSDETLPFEEDELSDSTPKNYSEYDFIVIGAGSAGATLASRISEAKNVTVLLIEAGGKEYSFMDIPSIAFALQKSDEVNWNYTTESSNKYCLGMTNNQCVWPRGKVMGGSSVLNLMMATRGNRRDYDEWAAESGDTSWSYRYMLKYFKKLESFRVNNIEYDMKLHNKNGPVPITSPDRIVLTDAFIEAGKELGYSEVDYNGIEQRGFSYIQSTIFKGERWSSNRAYLRPAKSRNNLIVTQHSQAHKILIDGASKNAYGVQYSKHKKIYEVRARKEIILNAGAIDSPKILMLSGIGPQKHLRKLNIRVIKDAPVGKNLQDHIACSGLIFKVNESAGTDVPNFLDPNSSAIKDYVNFKTGPLAIALSQGGMSYMNVDNPSSLYPNIEMIFMANQGIKAFSSETGIKENLRNQMNEDQFPHSAWSIWPMILRPRSSGQILLRSIDPFDKPIIHANYLSDAEDTRLLIKGIRAVIELSKTRAFQKLGTQLYRIPSSCPDYESDSDQYWECLLRTYTNTVYHYSGTCKMGRENSKSSVVNSKLKVIGINNLRVADASIMPNIISGHPNIPAIAIGEKAADMIKKEYGL